MGHDNDSADRGCMMTLVCEEQALTQFKSQTPKTHKRFVLATFGENGKTQVWNRMGTRPSCLLDLGVPGDVIDPAYALAYFDTRRDEWIFDDNSHPVLQRAAEEYIEEEVVLHLS